jgi:uncharacterized membrane protein
MPCAQFSLRVSALSVLLFFARLLWFSSGVFYYLPDGLLIEKCTHFFLSISNTKVDLDTLL